MKVIVAGSRHFNNKNFIWDIIDNSPFPITELVHGCAKGVDTIAGEWALHNKISVKEFPANWEKYGKGAGPVRNMEMAKYADALIAIIFENSRGTMNMIQTALKLGLHVFVINPDKL